jgi:hypothetical protein
LRNKLRAPASAAWLGSAAINRLSRLKTFDQSIGIIVLTRSNSLQQQLAATIRGGRRELTMNKAMILIFALCAMALSACGATTPVPAGLMMSAPGENGAYTTGD